MKAKFELTLTIGTCSCDEMFHISEVGFFVGKKFVDLTNFKRNCHIADETLAETIQREMEGKDV